MDWATVCIMLCVCVWCIQDSLDGCWMSATCFLTVFYTQTQRAYRYSVWGFLLFARSISLFIYLFLPSSFSLSRVHLSTAYLYDVYIYIFFFYQFIKLKWSSSQTIVQIVLVLCVKKKSNRQSVSKLRMDEKLANGGVIIT